MATVTRSVLHGWPTRRFELMRTRVCDLGVTLEDSHYDPIVERVREDLLRRGLPWMPPMYLSNGWHCPDRVPIIGVPFALATRDLRRIEKEVTNLCEDTREMVRLLRHEVGHAYNYALRLHETSEWRRLFGPFSRPYRETYSVKAASRQHVRHLAHHYAQKHPDEDFAETFATWLQPRARWQREYAGWGALRKLEYVDKVMRQAVGFHPSAVRGSRVDPVEQLRVPLGQHYADLGYPVEELGFDRQAAGYVDEDLRAVLKRSRAGSAVDAGVMLRRLRRRIVEHVVSLLSVRPAQAQDLYEKYVDRAGELSLRAGSEAEPQLLVGMTAIMTNHLMNMRHEGRVTRPRRVGCRV